MPSPHIVHTISAFDVFGPEKTVINECLALQKIGWRATIVNFWDVQDTPFSRKLAGSGIPYQCIPSRSKFDMHAIAALRALIENDQGVAVHSHGYKADLYSLIAARRARRPVVTTVHGWTSENMKVRLYERLQAFTWRFFDRVICVSRNYRNVANARGVPGDRLVLIANAIRANYAERPGEREREAMRAEFDVPAGHVVVAIIGRLGIEKAHALFVKAAQRILKDGGKAVFLIIGEGQERDNIEALIEQYGLGRQVKMLGHRDDVARLFAIIDILAICSLREGLPNVLLEAMLNGVPAVATGVGGIPDVVHTGINGILTPPGQEEDFIRALAELVSQPEKRNALGVAARASIEQEYLFDRRMERVMALYMQVLRHAATTDAAGRSLDR